MDLIHIYLYFIYFNELVLNHAINGFNNLQLEVNFPFKVVVKLKSFQCRRVRGRNAKKDSNLRKIIMRLNAKQNTARKAFSISTESYTADIMR